MEMRYEPIARKSVRRPTATFGITKEEQSQQHGEVPTIYNPKTHARNTVFKQPTTLGDGGELEGGSFTSFMNNFSSGVFKGLTLGLL